MMTDGTGMPIWYELMTDDVEGARRFYGDVVGWTTEDVPTGAADGASGYSTWQADDGEAISGLMQRPDGAPTGAGWFPYFHVADVDAKVAVNEAAGGVTCMPATSMGDVGRIAMVADPRHIVFYLMKPTPPADRPDATSTAFSQTLPQRCLWNELLTTDHTAALDYYGKLLGWTSTEAMPMPGMGDYSFVDCGNVRLGAMMDAAPAQPTGWMFYFAVTDVDVTAGKVTRGGGRVMMGPHDVPGGQRIIMCTDPQGARVGFVSGSRS